MAACCSVTRRRERDSNPRWRFWHHTRLASEHLRPLGHLSQAPAASLVRYSIVKPAEEEGFEPPAPFDAAVFKTAAFDRSATPPGRGTGEIHNLSADTCKGKSRCWRVTVGASC